MVTITIILVAFAAICFAFSFMHYTNNINFILRFYNNIEFKSNKHRKKFRLIEYRHYLLCGVLFLIAAGMVYKKMDFYLYTAILMIIVSKMASQQSKLKQLEYNKIV